MVYHALPGYGAPVGWAERLRTLRDRADGFVRRDLWSPDYYRRMSTATERGALLAGRVAYLVWLGFSRERLRLRAAALTYMTLLSLVPALAVVFSLFTAFGGLEDAGLRLKAKVVSWLSVSHQQAVTAYLDQFVGSVHAGALGGFGVVVLLLTALSLLSNIEKSFNDIWGLEEDRSWVRRFQSFFPMLTLGPVLFGLSLTATASIESSDTVRTLVEVLPGAQAALRLGPLLLTWFGFGLFYVLMPNTRVPVRYGLIGGVVAGSLWEIAKRVYTVYAAKAITYSAIYGSLGVVPLSIIWIYVSWLIALIGALLTYATQNAATYEPDLDHSLKLSDRDRIQLAVRMLLLVFERFERGQGATDIDVVLNSVAGPPRAERQIVRDLVEAGLLVETDDSGLVPGMPAHQTTLANIVDVVHASGQDVLSDRGLAGAALRAASALDEVDAAARKDLGSISIATLMASVDQTAAAVPDGAAESAS